MASNMMPMSKAWRMINKLLVDSSRHFYIVTFNCPLFPKGTDYL